MPKSVIIIGASGHGKVIADIVIKSDDNLIGYLDDGIAKNTSVSGFNVLGKTDDFIKYENCEFIIAIGDPIIREKIANCLPVKWYTAIHPTAVISSIGVNIGEGTTIMANAVVNSCSEIGKHCIINTASVVEHDNILEDFVHISPNATLAGSVKIGKATHIGVGACVRNNIFVSSDCVIGASATVVKNIIESGTYIGTPARRYK